MEKIKLITDSSSDLSKDIREKYNIGTALISIIIENKSYFEHKEMNINTLLENLKEGKDISTSMPSPQSFLDEIKIAVKEGYNKVFLLIQSSGTSGSYQSAKIAKDLYLEENSEIEIYVLDSQSMSHGLGLLTLKSARLIEEGYTFKELIDFNEKYKTKVKHLLNVSDLDNLIKSGRLNSTMASVGKILKIQPVMSMDNGKGSVIAKIRGKKRAMKYFADELEEKVDDNLSDFIIIGYSSDISLAKELETRLKEVYNKEIIIMQMGAAVSTHVGIGGLSLFFIEK